jgi:hypothetical protein
MRERRCGVSGRGIAWVGEEIFCVSVAGCCKAFQLLEMVDVVAGHGFYDGPEGHGAALGMGGGAMAFVAGDGGEEEEVPVAHGLEESECRLDGVDGVPVSPGFLIEGLDDVVGLVGRGGEGLAEAKSEDGFGVGEVGDDVGDAPLAGGWRGVELRFGEVGGEGVQAPGGDG